MINLISAILGVIGVRAYGCILRRKVERMASRCQGLQDGADVTGSGIAMADI